jgi:putative phage-type endonuclease
VKENLKVHGRLGIDTKDLKLFYPDETDDWDAIRRTGVGGTDIGVIMGVTPKKWTTLEQLLDGKLNGAKREQTEAMYWGTALEPIVAETYSKRRNVKLLDCKGTFVKVVQGVRLIANIDRFICDDDGKAVEILEVKTGNFFGKNKWGGGLAGYDIPIYYRHQVNWYMGITGIYKAKFAVLLGGQEYFVREVNFDEDLFDAQVSAAVAFWQKHVRDRSPLPIDAPFTLKDDDGEKRDYADMPELADLAELWWDKKREIETAKELQDEVKGEMLNLMGDTQYALAAAFRVRHYFKKASKKFDAATFQKECPDTYDKYIKIGKQAECFEIETIF